VYYAHEARAYALWVLCLAVAIVLLLEAVSRRTWRWWTAFAAAVWFSMHVHYFTAFWAAASIGAVFLADQRRSAVRKWAASVATAVLAFLPYFFLAVLPAARGGGSAWIAPSFDPATSIPNTLWAFLPAGAYPAHLRGLSLASADTLVHQPAVLVFASQALPAAILAGCLLMLARRRARQPKPPPLAGQTRVHAALAILTLGPLLLALFYSLAVRPIYLVGRYDLVAWPGAIVWLSCLLVDSSRGNDGRIRRALLAGICVLLLMCSLVPLHRLFAFEPSKGFHRLRAERLAQLAGPADLVIAFSYDRDYLAYYLHRSGFRGTIRSFPTWLEQQVGWIDTPADLGRLDEAAADARRLGEDMDRRLAAGEQVYLLGDSIDPESRRPIQQAILSVFELLGLSVRLMDPDLLIYKITRAAG
jgi:hypothetical protein